MPNVTVNATISARDAASKNIKKVNAALGTLGKTASNIGSDFRKLGLGAIGIAAGVGAFTASAIKDAAADEQATAKLNAALKARGLATASVLAAVEKQIVAGQKLAFTDDEVRASVEASTRFTKNYAVAQKIQTVAMNLARTTGMSLGDATIAVGKAYQGSGAKLLTSIGITKKGIKGQEALNALLGKTRGAAAAYADTVAGSFESLSIGAQELKEQFGKAFLPALAKLFKGLNPYIERLSKMITDNTPKLQEWADIIVTKILDKLPGLFRDFEANVPRAMKRIEEFVNGITGIGKEADKLLGPGGSITLLVSGIGAAFGGLKGTIAANLIKGGTDPFTALIVSNIAAQVPAALASALTNVIVTKAVAAFGASTAAAAAGGAATTAAGGAGGGLSILGGLTSLPVTILALSVAATAALTSAITSANMTNKIGGNNVIDIFGTTAATTATTPPKDIFKDLGDLWTFITTGVQPTASVTPLSGSTTNNIFIGTGKVDTVVSDSITRIKSRGRNP